MSIAPLNFEASRCVSCGGWSAFDPGSSSLVCTYCGAATDAKDRQTVQGVQAAAQEIFDAAAPSLPPLPPLSQLDVDFDTSTVPAGSGPVGDLALMNCESCGGELAYTSHDLSTNCPYCAGHLVRSPASVAQSAAARMAVSLVPFSVDRRRAEASLRDWLADREALPSRLDPKTIKLTVSSVYVPFWQVDGQVCSRWEAEASRSIGPVSLPTRVSGRQVLVFEDVLSLASTHISSELRDGIGPYSSADLVSFSKGYLAGHGAELHRATPQASLDDLGEEFRAIVEHRVRAGMPGGGAPLDRIALDGWDAEVTPVLMPVWIAAYECRGKRYQICASGQTGKAWGERPWSTVAIAMKSVIEASALVGAGLLAGAILLLL